MPCGRCGWAAGREGRSQRQRGELGEEQRQSPGPDPDVQGKPALPKASLEGKDERIPPARAWRRRGGRGRPGQGEVARRAPIGRPGTRRLPAVAPPHQSPRGDGLGRAAPNPEAGGGWWRCAVSGAGRRMRGTAAALPPCPLAASARGGGGGAAAAGGAAAVVGTAAAVA